MEKAQDPYIGLTLFSKYFIKKRLGEGSFGTTYLALSGKKQYAIKIEKKRMNTNNTIKYNSLIITEANLMKSLIGCAIPKIYEVIQDESSNIMIMERLGKSLEMLLHLVPDKKMSIKTVAMLGYHMISILEFVHSQDIIHRDIKPDNFAMGHNKKNNMLYLIDFGLAKYYRDPVSKVHNPLILKKKLTGTARYASLNALQGIEQSRRDDLESVGYCLIYLLKGTLPWKTIMIKNKEEKYMKIMQKKKVITPSELCKNEPIEFERFLKYCKGLAYDDDPNYDYMKDLFFQCLSRLHYSFDNCYDWIALELISSSELPSVSSKSYSYDKHNENPSNNYSKLNEQHDIIDKDNQFNSKHDLNKAYINNYVISQSSIQKDKNSTNHIVNNNANEQNGNLIPIIKLMKNQDEFMSKVNSKTKAKKSSSITHYSKGKSSSKILSVHPQLQPQSVSHIPKNQCLSKCCIVV